jgi:hypothetical protein
MLGGDGKEYGPVSADQLRQWAAEGRANLQTQVRPTEGGAWAALGAVPELNAPAGYAAAAANPGLASVLAQTTNVAADDPTAQVKRLAATLASASGWMKFLAIVMFVISGLYVLVSFGIALIFVWVYIWLGIVFMAIASNATRAVQSGSEADLNQALDRVRFAFKFCGILMIVSLVLGLIVGVFVALGFFAGMAGALHGGGSSFGP